MKISIFCQFEENTACGIHMHGKSRGLANQGHRVHLVCHPFKYAARGVSENKTAGNVRVSVVYSGFFGKGNLLHKFISLFPLLMLNVPSVLVKLRRSEAVILHKPLPLALFYQILLKVTLYRGKILCILDDWEGVGGMATVRQANSILMKLAATLSDEAVPVLSHGIVCSSRLSMEKMALSRLTRDKCLYIPLGASEAEDGIPEQNGLEFTVGYVGTFKSRDLIDFLTAVIARTSDINPQVNFRIVGGGEEFNYLEKKIESEKLEKNVVLTGQVEHSRVQEELKKVSVCLLYLNHRFPENYIDASRSSTKMFEYMALGKVIVASGFGEPLNILENGKTGFLVENTPEAFARQLDRLQKSPETAGQMAPEIVRTFKSRYSHRVLMKKLSEWMESL